MLGNVGDPNEEERKEKAQEVADLKATSRKGRSPQRKRNHDLLHKRLAHAKGEGPRPEPEAVDMSQVSAMGSAFTP